MLFRSTKSKASVSGECVTEIPNLLIASVIKPLSAESGETSSTEIGDGDDSVITSTQSYNSQTTEYSWLAESLKGVYFGKLMTDICTSSNRDTDLLRRVGLPTTPTPVSPYEYCFVQKLEEKIKQEASKKP